MSSSSLQPISARLSRLPRAVARSAAMSSTKFTSSPSPSIAAYGADNAREQKQQQQQQQQQQRRTPWQSAPRRLVAATAAAPVASINRLRLLAQRSAALFDSLDAENAALVARGLIRLGHLPRDAETPVVEHLASALSSSSSSSPGGPPQLSTIRIAFDVFRDLSTTARNRAALDAAASSAVVAVAAALDASELRRGVANDAPAILATMAELRYVHPEAAAALLRAAQRGGSGAIPTEVGAFFAGEGISPSEERSGANESSRRPVPESRAVVTSGATVQPQLEPHHEPQPPQALAEVSAVVQTVTEGVAVDRSVVRALLERHKRSLEPSSSPSGDIVSKRFVAEVAGLCVRLRCARSVEASTICAAAEPLIPKMSPTELRQISVLIRARLPAGGAPPASGSTATAYRASDERLAVAVAHRIERFRSIDVVSAASLLRFVAKMRQRAVNAPPSPSEGDTAFVRAFVGPRADAVVVMLFEVALANESTVKNGSVMLDMCVAAASIEHQEFKKLLLPRGGRPVGEAIVANVSKGLAERTLQTGDMNRFVTLTCALLRIGVHLPANVEAALSSRLRDEYRTLTTPMVHDLFACLKSGGHCFISTPLTCAIGVLMLELEQRASNAGSQVANDAIDGRDFYRPVGLEFESQSALSMSGDERWQMLQLLASHQGTFGQAFEARVGAVL